MECEGVRKAESAKCESEGLCASAVVPHPCSSPHCPSPKPGSGLGEGGSCEAVSRVGAERSLPKRARARRCPPDRPQFLCERDGSNA